ncbi:uncharacterized protein LOC109833106 [Asparagus officinalis]|uniref:uncharacterized protein LOC109833106 n=1 Tax=Asparagus officinalis TaxID=4686 RepID=UPI00098E5C22|nr:uncharacterized protein LOC109833106 [Asparagus officinalis]
MSKSAIHLNVDSGPKQGETLDRKPGTLIRIGRVVKGNTLAIKESSISQKHLTIEFDAQICRWVVRDLDTSNGTFVNGDRVPSSAAVQLSDGDTVKIGECTSISVKISVIKENLGGVKRNSGKRGRSRSTKEDGDCEEIGDRNCERVSTKYEILDRSEEVSENLKRGRKQNTKRDLSKDEILASALDDVVEAKNLARVRRRNPVRVLKEDNVIGTTIVDKIEVHENLRRSNKAEEVEEIRKQNKAEKVEEIRKQNCESMKDDNLDSVVEDGAKEVLMNLGKGKKQNPIRASKKDRVLESASDERIEVVQNSGRIEGISNKYEVTEMVVEERFKAPGNLGRARRGRTVKFPMADVVEDSINVPKNRGRGRRATSAQILEKDPSLDLDVVDKTEQPKDLHKQRGRNSSSVSIDSENLEPVVESSIKAPVELLVSKKDGVLEDNAEVPKTMVGRRKTRSTKVSVKDDISNLIVDDNIRALKNVGRRKNTSSSTVSTLDETLHSVVEDITEVPKKLRRGKRKANLKVLNIDETSEAVMQAADEEAKNVGRAKPNNVSRGRSTSSSGVATLDEILNAIAEDVSEVPKNLGRGKKRANSKVSKLDDISEVVVHDAVEEVKNVGRGKSGKAPARITRTSSRVSTDEKVLQPAQDPVLSTIDKLHQSKDLRGGSHQLTEADKIQLNSNDKKSKNGEDKENYVSVKCPKTESRRDLLKVWNGNGIPNTTTKYMEDKKVSWHATPFEERLEKALSDDKLYPQRNLTN